MLNVYNNIYILVWHDGMVSCGSLFCLIKSHLGLVSVNETSQSLLGLLLLEDTDLVVSSSY
jgi:hypothetical protein